MVCADQICWFKAVYFSVEGVSPEVPLWAGPGTSDLNGSYCSTGNAEHSLASRVQQHVARLGPLAISSSGRTHVRRGDSLTNYIKTRLAGGEHAIVVLELSFGTGHHGLSSDVVTRRGNCRSSNQAD
jgi:hypothetical protein